MKSLTEDVLIFVAIVLLGWLMLTPELSTKEPCWSNLTDVMLESWHQNKVQGTDLWIDFDTPKDPACYTTDDGATFWKTPL